MIRNLLTPSPPKFRCPPPAGPARPRSPTSSRTRWLAAALAVPLLALVVPPQAQTTTTLVSNFAQSTTSSEGLPLGSRAQGFTTGSNPDGYDIETIQIRSTDPTGRGANASLWSESSGSPGTKLFTFINPASFGANPTFTAPSSTPQTTLASDTTYFFVLNRTSTFNTYLSIASSGSEDSDGADGWSVGDTRLDLTDDGWEELDDGPYMIKVKGLVSLPEITLKVSVPHELTEGDSGHTPLVGPLANHHVYLSLDRASTLPVQVNVRSEDGTATAGVDYVAIDEVVTIPAGRTDWGLSVYYLGDVVVEDQEHFRIVLSDPVNAYLHETDYRADVPIFDDDLADANNAPVFAEGESTTRSVAENTAAGQEVGSPVAATDADTHDTLAYTLGGADAAWFDIVSTSGQLRTKSGVTYDHEAKPSLAVTVTVSDGTASDRIAVTIGVDDMGEPPLAPEAPSVSPASTTSLNVTWHAPANTGRPAITDYDLRYRANGVLSWTDGPQNVPGTSAAITDLETGTACEVQVRATNDEGDGSWSPSGTGTTPDTDPPPVVSIQDSLAVGEEAGSFTFDVVAETAIDQRPTQDFQVTLSIDGTRGESVDLPCGFPCDHFWPGGAIAEYYAELAEDYSIALSTLNIPSTAYRRVSKGRRGYVWRAVMSASGSIVRDQLLEGDEIFRIRLDQAVPTPLFALGNRTLTVTIVDDERPKLLVNGELPSPIMKFYYAFPEVTVSHEGDQGGTPATPGTYTLRLNQAPVRSLTVTSVVASLLGKVSPEILTFTPGNWSEPQTVAITPAPDDDVYDDHISISHWVVKFAAYPEPWVVDTRVEDDESGPPTVPGNQMDVGAWVSPIDMTPPKRPYGPRPDGFVFVLNWHYPYHDQGKNRHKEVHDGGSPITGFVVESSPDGRSWTQWARPQVGDRGLEHWVHNCCRLYGETESPGTTRHFRVAAVNAVGMGPWSETVHATIGGDPTDEVSIVAQQDSAVEGAPAKFTLHRKRGSMAEAREVKVRITENDGDRVASGDEGERAVTFAAGKRMTTLAVATRNDTVDEPDGSVTVEVLPGVGHAVDPNGAAATVAIGDDDDGSALASAALTARFEAAPAEHDGASRFTFELRFSEEVELSYRTLRDEAFEVTGGSVVRARRLAKPTNLHWEITVAPDSFGDVTVALPADRPCVRTEAICTAGGKRLSHPLELTVPGPPLVPLTAAFHAMPAEHDGESAFTVELRFSEEVAGLSYRTLRDSAFTVTNGRVTRARRLARPSNLRWEITVAPGGPGDVTVALPPTADCAASGAICTADGRRLESALALTIQGPPALSVADARAEEGTDETLDFAVTLERAPAETVAVDYATADGTATAGSDYTAASGTLTFAPGETAKTVAVAVLDDAIDEGEETLTLTLSDATGARIADGEAVGTISNRDPLQKMWLARFGRTAASHVVDAVSGRLSDGSSVSQVTLGGQRIDLARVSDEAAIAEAMTGLARALGAWSGPEPDAGSGPGGWPHTRGDPAAGAGDVPGTWPPARGGVRDDAASSGSTARSLSGRELLLGSAFHLSSEGGDGGAPAFAAWGRVTAGGFDAEEKTERGTVRLDGEVTTGTLGADAAWERWLAGVALSVSEGEGTFDQPGVDSGTVESRLTSVSPYVRLDVNERVRAWGLLGWGTGEMTMTQAPTGARTEESVTRTDIEMRLGALGARGALLKADASGGVDLALRADAFLVEMEWEKVSNETETTAGASRLRLVLEGSRTFARDDGAALTPGLELGVRHDGGDAETGTGVEMGGSIHYADAGSGLSVEASARTLIAHEASGFEEWGASASVRLDPGASGRGLSFTLAPTLGAASSATERLWSMADAQGLAANGDFEAEARLSAELGYGLSAGGGAFTGTPYAGLGLSESGRDWRLGWRLGSVRREALDFTLGLEGTRSESADDESPEHGLMLRGSLRW